MKKSIKLSALFLLLSTGLFAATPYAKINMADKPSAVSVTGLSETVGIAISVDGQLSASASVKITDMEGHQLYAGTLSNQKGSAKKYNLSQLENGDYTITIYANKQELKKQVHIYDENGKKAYFIFQ